MKHNWGDILFGVAGTTTSFGLGALNLTLGCLAGLLTCMVMAFRVRKEWRDRDK